MENQFSMFLTGIRRLLGMLSNCRGEVSLETPEGTEELNPEGQQLEGAEGAGGKTPETPEGQEEVKIYAGRFKSPEEMETAYKHSSQEGIRLAGEVRRLQQMVQSAITPAQKQEAADKVTDLTKHFDPETSRVLDEYFEGLVEKRFAKNNQENKAQSEFQAEVSKNWEETKKLYPEAANPKSKVYIRANEILFERNLAEVKTDGTVHVTSPFAYRTAVEAAVLELSRQAPSANKGKVGAIAGRGSRPVAQGKLTYEQYMALPSDDARDAYDKSQIN